MQINITGRHFDLTDSIKEHINTEFQKINKHTDSIINVRFTLDVEKYRNKCEIDLKVLGQHLVASEETNDMYLSIDKAIEKMERNVKKLKSKITNHKQREEAIAETSNEKEFFEAAEQNSFE